MCCRLYLITINNNSKKKKKKEPRSSPYTTPVFFVGKKDSKELRLVMDYQEINKWTIVT
jgi:hypothetical protein